MFALEKKSEPGCVILRIAGRIESSNASSVEREIFSAMEGLDDADRLVLDAEDLAYVSSAGLRVVLRVKKAHKNTVVTNVRSDVYEIFDMTGFTEMMEIEKAYRTVDITGCEILGEGANGVVYRVGADMIVKVYRNADALEEIQKERDLARKAFVMGVPTAIPYDVVKVGDKYGSVFEMLDALSFAAILQRQPERVQELAKAGVDILKIIHATKLKPGDLPDVKIEARSWVSHTEPYLKRETFVKLRRLVEDIPDTTNMLHGDFHIKNIMRQGGENLLIDMDTLTMGHPVFELAAIYLAYVGFSELDPTVVEKFLGIPAALARRFFDETMRFYFGTDDEEKLREVEKKLRVLCFTRLVRRTLNKTQATEEEKSAMLTAYVSGLEELVPTMDKLYF